MFRKVLTKEQIAESLSPYQKGQRFRLRKDIRTGEGLYAKGTEIEVIGCAVRDDADFHRYTEYMELPDIYEGEESEWFAESSLFTYDLACMENGNIIRSVSCSAFADKVISPERQAAEREYRKKVLFLWSAFFLLMIFSILGMKYVDDKFFFLGLCCVIPYAWNDRLSRDRFSAVYLLTRVTKAK